MYLKENAMLHSIERGSTNQQASRWKACHLFACWFAEPISSTLKMEAVCSSETSVETQRTTRRRIPEDNTLHNHHCENLKSYTRNLLFSVFTPIVGQHWCSKLIVVVHPRPILIPVPHFISTNK
jgi:hypothetical protein